MIKTQPKNLEYLYNARLILMFPEIYELEIASELAIVDGGLVEGQVLEMINQDYKINVKIGKDLVSVTPATYTDVIIETYEQAI